MATYERTHTGSAVTVAEVTTSDATILNPPARSLYIGGAGNVKVTTVGGTTATFVAVPAGKDLNVQASVVWANGTNATNIVAYFY